MRVDEEARSILLRSLQALARTGKQKFATEEVLAEVGCAAGRVPPIGHAKPHRTFADPRVLAHEFVYLNPGEHTRTMKIASGELRKLLGDTVLAEFGTTPERVV